MGALVSVGLAVGAQWVPWLAVVAALVAVVAGVVATSSAWREHLAVREAQLAEASQTRAAHTATLTAMHRDHREVLHVLGSRAQDLRVELTQARAEAGELQQELSSVRGDREALRHENDDLRAQLAAGESEAVEAEVVTLPRRRASATSPDWVVSEAPTVVDLDLQRLAFPFVEDVVRRHAK